MYEWHSFLEAADEWFITYSLPPPLTCVKLFAIGHTVELYLKAVNTKVTGDIERVIKLGHGIKSIWDDCKEQDPNFMPSFEIRDSVFNANLFKDGGRSLDRADYEHFLEDQELYIVAKILPDLKYLGAPLKKIEGAFSIGFVHPNPYWINFFKELRGYIGHPDKSRLDLISYHIEKRDLPQESIRYLSGLYV